VFDRNGDKFGRGGQNVFRQLRQKSPGRRFSIAQARTTLSNLQFLSSLPLENRAELERLIFFNAHQERARSGIVRAVELYGAPKIAVTPEGLVVTLCDRLDAQCLFATARSRGRRVLAGMIIFLRTGLQEISVVHVAVADRYQRWHCAPTAIALALLATVRVNARRLRGVSHVRVVYGETKSEPDSTYPT
jgi:hypothetical protein